MIYQAVYFDWDGGEPNDAGANNTPEEQVRIFNNLFVVLVHFRVKTVFTSTLLNTTMVYIFCN